MSDILIAGYPSSNPILNGLNKLLQGEDVEEVLFERDQALFSDVLFLKSAWEALFWLNPDSSEIKDLMDQMAFLIYKMPVNQRSEKWGEALPFFVDKMWKEVYQFRG